MPVMVDSEGKYVSFNFPSVAEGRVKLMGAREIGAPHGSE
jgi:hypothetical protein